VEREFMKRIKKFVSELLWLVSNARSELSILSRRVEFAEKLIKDRTTISADLNYRGGGQIIIIGRYRNEDYIQTYSVPDRDLRGLIETLRNMQRYGAIRRIDAAPQLRAVIKREI
jgi:hypothetical protein